MRKHLILSVLRRPLINLSSRPTFSLPQLVSYRNYSLTSNPVDVKSSLNTPTQLATEQLKTWLKPIQEITDDQKDDLEKYLKETILSQADLVNLLKKIQNLEHAQFVVKTITDLILANQIPFHYLGIEKLIKQFLENDKEKVASLFKHFLKETIKSPTDLANLLKQVFNLKHAHIFALTVDELIVAKEIPFDNLAIIMLIEHYMKNDKSKIPSVFKQLKILDVQTTLRTGLALYPEFIDELSQIEWVKKESTSKGISTKEYFENSMINSCLQQENTNVLNNFLSKASFHGTLDAQMASSFRSAFQKLGEDEKGVTLLLRNAVQNNNHDALTFILPATHHYLNNWKILKPIKALFEKNPSDPAIQQQIKILLSKLSIEMIINPDRMATLEWYPYMKDTITKKEIRRFLLRALLKSDMKALNYLYEEMKQRNIPPDDMAFFGLIHHSSLSTEHSTFFENIIQEYKDTQKSKRFVTIPSMLVETLFRRGESAKIQELKPSDKYTFHFFQALSLFQPQELKDVFPQLNRVDLKLSSPQPYYLIYNVVRAFAEDPVLLEKFLEKIKDDEIDQHVSQEIQNVLKQLPESTENLAQLQDLVNSLKVSQEKIVPVPFYSLLNSYRKTLDQKIFKTLQQSLKQFSIDQKILAQEYRTLLYHFASVRDYKSLVETYRNIESTGLPLQSETLELVVNSFLKCLDIQTTIQVYRKHRKTTEISPKLYSTYIKLFSYKDHLVIKKIFSEVKEKGIKLTAPAYQSVLQTSLVTKDYDQADEVMNEAKKYMIKFLNPQKVLEAFYSPYRKDANQHYERSQLQKLNQFFIDLGMTFA